MDEEIVNAKVSAMLDDQDSGLLSSLATECLRPVLGDALVSNVKVAEITDIMVSMSKNDIQVRKTLLGLLGLLGLLFECFGWVYFFGILVLWGTFFLLTLCSPPFFLLLPLPLPSSFSQAQDAENATAMDLAKTKAMARVKEKEAEQLKAQKASDQKTQERIARREARKKKKADSVQRKKDLAMKKQLEEEERVAAEVEAKKRQLAPLLHPVKAWISAVKQDINYEDPRYQFGKKCEGSAKGV